MTARRQLLELYLSTLAELSPAALMPQRLRWREGRLEIGGEPESPVPPYAIDPDRYNHIQIFAVGKGANGMAAAWHALWTRQPKTARLSQSVLLAAPTENSDWRSWIARTAPEAPPADAGYLRCFRAGHPLPNAESLGAGAAFLRTARELPPRTLAVYLISGGASALLEAPFDPLFTLDEIRQTYQELIHSGATIEEINTVRKHLSAVKGGRLLATAPADTEHLSLIISDVAGGADAVGSGPTTPDRSSVAEAYAIWQRYRFRFPARVQALFQERRLPETPKADHPAFVRAHAAVLHDNPAACLRLAQKAAAAGLRPTIDHTADEWEYRRAAAYLVARLAALKREAPQACLIAGGEVRVRLAGSAGHGGRNQAFALACALKLVGTPWSILSAGTDGIDGNSSAAGALADGTTVERALEAGFDPQHHLDSFDAYPLFGALGDLVDTGPTGTNLRDLRLLA